ncbi:MAG: AraD1 family protein [Chitinophagaceae bacterium]
MDKEKLRLVQLTHARLGRKIALVNEPSLVLLNDFRSIYDMALKAIQTRTKLENLIPSNLSNEKLGYDEIYNGQSEWKLLPSFDHPGSSFGCIISGTGLTHKNSALNRQVMHASGENKLTDSMKIYQWGVEGGFPGKGKIGVQPEWFYKGTGSTLKAHGEVLEVPSYGDDGGEEPELAGVYLIDEEGQPWRIGFTTGNEFSDHIMEKKNYLYLAPSKLRQCSIGPELVISKDFEAFEGTVSVMRKEETIWTSDVKTGEKNMSHSLENIEHHQFKYKGHRIPLQAHVHFYGADAFSFGNGIKLQDGDLMRVQWNGMGRALQNPVKIIKEEDKLVKVKSF